MLTWQQFTSIPNGTRVLNHGWDQCVALANLYHESVIGGSFVGVGSAFQWWTEFGSWKTLTDNYVTRSRPTPGALFVARYGIYDAPNGHIGVVTSVNPDGTFNTMEQNAGTWRYVGRYTRGMANILGFLVPKNNPATGNSTGAYTETVTTVKEDNVANYYIWKKEGGKQINAIFDPTSGFFTEFESAEGKYNTNVAKTFGVATPTAGVSVSHYTAIKRDVAAVRTRG